MAEGKADRHLTALILAVALGGLGLLGVALGGSASLEVSQQARFLDVEANVTNVEIENHRSTPGTDQGRASHRRNLDFRVWVEYSYTVGGKTYRGRENTRIFDFRIDAENLASEIRQRGTLQVLYDPDKPTESVVNKTRPEIAHATLYVGCLLLVVGVGFACWARVLKRRQAA